jgi:hypothetical protein
VDTAGAHGKRGGGGGTLDGSPCWVTSDVETWGSTIAGDAACCCESHVSALTGSALVGDAAGAERKSRGRETNRLLHVLWTVSARWEHDAGREGKQPGKRRGGHWCAGMMGGRTGRTHASRSSTRTPGPP